MNMAQQACRVDGGKRLVTLRGKLPGRRRSHARLCIVEPAKFKLQISVITPGAVDLEEAVL